MALFVLFLVALTEAPQSFTVCLPAVLHSINWWWSIYEGHRSLTIFTSVLSSGNSPQKEEGRSQNSKCWWQETSGFTEETVGEHHHRYRRGEDEASFVLFVYVVNKYVYFFQYTSRTFFQSYSSLLCPLQVNMIKNDGTVIHFNNPKVQASLSANTFSISGHAETKQLTEMLPGILSQLGADSITNLRKLAEQFPRQGESVPELSWSEDFKLGVDVTLNLRWFAKQNHWQFFIFYLAMDSKSVKEEIAEEEDDDVPGTTEANLMSEHLSRVSVILFCVFLFFQTWWRTLTKLQRTKQTENVYSWSCDGRFLNLYLPQTHKGCFLLWGNVWAFIKRALHHVCRREPQPAADGRRADPDPGGFWFQRVFWYCGHSKNLCSRKHFRSTVSFLHRF